MTTLLQKLMTIKKAMPYLKKENKNKGQGFDYVSSSQVLKIFREKCDELNIMVIPEIITTKINPTPSGNQTLTEMRINYNFIDVENPDDNLEIAFYAQGADQAEKGVGKALTYGEKYMILKLFNIPTDKDDPDAAPLPAFRATTPDSNATIPKPESAPRDDEKTEKFMKAMHSISKKLIERDGNDKAIAMVLDFVGHEKVSDVTGSDDRRKVVSLLMKDLNITNLEDLLG